MVTITARQRQPLPVVRNEVNDSVDVVYRDTGDRLHHQGVINALAAKLDAPVAQVACLYETRLRDLRADAVVTVFLPILIEKHVQAVIRRERGR